MKYKKFLLIPALLVAYIYLVVPLFIESNLIGGLIAGTTTTAPQQTSGVEALGVGETVSVSVTRPYLFGLIELPVYISPVGNIGIYHDMFFAFIMVLAFAFLAIEIINWRKKHG